MTAAQAIEQSIRTNEIVTLGTAREPAEDLEDVKSELFACCDDCANTDERSALAEYWGTDDSGEDTWRVHVWQ